VQETATKLEKLQGLARQLKEVRAMLEKFRLQIYDSLSDWICDNVVC
jgi:hypothetical protein